MSTRPLVPLRWYEHLLLRFLSRSPRIVALHVIQAAAPPDPTESVQAAADFLERAYEAPAVDRRFS